MVFASTCKMSSRLEPKRSFRPGRIKSERTPSQLKSYSKHRHKRPKRLEADLSFELARRGSRDQLDCDKPQANEKSTPNRQSRGRRPKRNDSKLIRVCMIVRICQILLVTMAALAAGQLATAFCPARCHCNDLELSANCTQISSISIVPMTLNPLLKRLTLNQLPISELSNSLSIYHQLQVLNLNSNLLARIRYQNFNFKPAPHVISLAASSHQAQDSHQQQQQPSNDMMATQNRPEASELQARHLRQSFERSELLETSEGEIRHHLRELHLANNRLDQLGDFGAYSEAQQQEQQQSGAPMSSQSKLRAHELEKLAPFLSLSKLELLDLSGNQLARLHQHAFLGLLRLKHLDLSRNQLEFVDKHALVGLLALERLKLNANKLGHYQHQLNQFGAILCRGPLLELAELDLSENSARGGAQTMRQLSKQTQLEHLVLPNELAVCSPKLRNLKLRALNLKHLQVNALDQLNQLHGLDLSENPLEQVPLDALVYSRSNLTSSLRRLDLSDTQIEFIAAGTFVQLRQLEQLQMNRMSQLLSFDLASLITSQQQVSQNEFKFINKNLRQLHLNQNKRLQSVHSSLGSPIQFDRLEVVDLAHSGELREFQLERVITFEPAATTTTTENKLAANQQRARLQVDLSSANSLNCSACQMGWLVRAAQQQQAAAAAAPEVAQHQPAASWPHAIPETSQLGWSPIPFDPFSSSAQAVPAVHFAPGSLPTAQPRPPATGPDASTPPLDSSSLSSVKLLHLEALNCAWPFSMPLIELIGLETNYAPLFDRNCVRQQQQQQQQQKPATRWNHLQGGPGPNSSAGLVVANELSTERKSTQEVRLLAPVVGSGGAHNQDNNLEGPIWVGAALLVGLLLIVTFKLVQLLVVRRSRALMDVERKFSPSFTATTSPGSSSSASSSGSSNQAYFKQVAAVWSPGGQPTACLSDGQPPNWAPIQSGPKPNQTETLHHERQQQQQQWARFHLNQSAATTMRPAFNPAHFSSPPPPPPDERAQIKEFVWAAQEAVEGSAGSDGSLKQSNLFSRFVGRLSGRRRRQRRPSFNVAAATLAGNNNQADEWRRRALSNSVQSFGLRQSNKRQHENDNNHSSSANYSYNYGNNNHRAIEHEQLDYAQLASNNNRQLQFKAPASRPPDDGRGNQLAIYGNQQAGPNEYAICGFEQDLGEPERLGRRRPSLRRVGAPRSGPIEMVAGDHFETASDYEDVGAMALDASRAQG